MKNSMKNTKYAKKIWRVEDSRGDLVGGDNSSYPGVKKKWSKKSNYNMNMHAVMMQKSLDIIKFHVK